MTIARAAVDAAEPTTLTGALLDALTEALILSPDRGGRAVIVSRVISEIESCVDWLRGEHQSSDDELAGVRALASVAYMHHLAMTRQVEPPGLPERSTAMGNVT